LKSIYGQEYRHLLSLLVQVRKDAGITQQELAGKLGRPQSFVSKFERGERRIDVVEFLAISRAIGADPHALIRQIERLPPKKH
jgi:transcriptional regulator with XRE-family HTH domain